MPRLRLWLWGSGPEMDGIGASLFSFRVKLAEFRKKSENLELQKETEDEDLPKRNVKFNAAKQQESFAERPAEQSVET